MPDSFTLGGNVNIGTPGEQEFPADNTPPGYTYRPPANTYGDAVAISECPHSLNEFKARVEAGRVFFRAREVGPGGNAISVTCSEVVVSPLLSNFTLTVTNGTITETYHATQTRTIDVLPPFGYIYVTNAAETFREDVNESSALIDMPERKYDLIDNLGTDTRTERTINRASFDSVYPDGEDHIEAFTETHLYGGLGVPSNPTAFGTYPATGPQRTVAHINFSERNTDNGTLILENILVQWSGETATQGGWVQCGVRASLSFG